MVAPARTGQSVTAAWSGTRLNRHESGMKQGGVLTLAAVGSVRLSGCSDPHRLLLPGANSSSLSRLRHLCVLENTGWRADRGGGAMELDGWRKNWCSAVGVTWGG